MKALCEELAVSRRTVHRWVKLGCPCGHEVSPKGGRPRLAFDVLEVKQWLISQGISPVASPASGHGGPEVGSGKPKNTSPLTEEGPGGRRVEQAPTATISGVGFDAMLERLRLAERTMFGAWAEAVKRRDFVQAAGCAKQWLDQAEQLRRVEKDQSSVRRDADAWLSHAEVLEAFTRWTAEIKTLLLALPRALAPRLAGLTATQIEAVLNNEVYRVLTLLSEKTW